jgi:hypothetical protein
MKALWFLLWVPALLIFYLSIHDEFVRERRRHRADRSPVTSRPPVHHLR